VALEMKTALLGPNDPAVAQTIYLLSFLMPYLSRMEASETLYKRALAIQQSANPPDPRRTETMIQLATILTRLGKPDEAEVVLREATDAEDPYRAVIAGLELADADYAWVTRELMAVAAKHTQGRIVSTLEGGYSLSALGRSAALHIRELVTG